MCRNIRVLHHFEPPTTEGEIHDAALQYVRKVSGYAAPLVADREAFERAVETIATVTRTLLEGLKPRPEARTREGERSRNRRRWEQRQARAK